MNFKTFTRSLAFAAGILGTSTALADKLAAGDLDNVAHEHAVNQQEIAMGNLAQKQSSTAGVKAYGATLVKDHTSADSNLTALAKKKGTATIPKDVPKTDADKAAMKDDMDGMAKLKTLKGADFDSAFLGMMAAAHEREAGKLQTAISATQDADLKAQLQGDLPVMQGHASTARDLQKNATSPAMTPKK